MTSIPATPEPLREALERLLSSIRHEGFLRNSPWSQSFADAIIAARAALGAARTDIAKQVDAQRIPAVTETLDVERLARALDYTTAMEEVDAHRWAPAIAAEYARLSEAPADPETT